MNVIASLAEKFNGIATEQQGVWISREIVIEHDKNLEKKENET